jgi:hypothetical protein
MGSLSAKNESEKFSRLGTFKCALRTFEQCWGSALFDANQDPDLDRHQNDADP